jgi:hypothetical protein
MSRGAGELLGSLPGLLGVRPMNYSHGSQPETGLMICPLSYSLSGSLSSGGFYAILIIASVCAHTG